MLDQLRAEFPHLHALAPASTATLDLPGQPESVRRARTFTRTTLQGWRLGEHFDSVALVVSELVTNAVRYGLSGDARDGCGNGRGQVHGHAHTHGHAHARGSEVDVELELMRYAGRLICAVRDASDAAPRLASDEEVTDPGDAESGRGLYLVDCLSDGWGWRPLTNRSGKVVWAVFETG